MLTGHYPSSIGGAQFITMADDGKRRSARQVGLPVATASPYTDPASGVPARANGRD